MRNFANYELGDSVYELADGLLPEMARALEYDLGEQPTDEALSGLIGHIGPAKTLQDNIGRVQEILGTDADALTLAATWVERSGVLMPVYRSFTSPEAVTHDTIDTAIITGGVARWMLRRAETAQSHVARFNKLLMPVGNRNMGQNEHELVATHIERTGSAPTESEFAETYVTPILRQAGVTVEVIPVPSSNGEEVFAGGLTQQPDILDGTILVIGNAPATAFTTGQFRSIARAANGEFDRDGNQLFMVGDGITVARKGEGPATHQNPYTALGQIARTALIINRQ